MIKSKFKVYLDSSVISALYDSRNPDRKALTEEFFNQINNFDVFISEINIQEIERTNNIKLKTKMKNLISGFHQLLLNDEIDHLAKEYISYGAIPETYSEDAYHIAVSVINELDYLLSWNFKHFIRRRTREIVKMINTLNNLKQIEIITPAELL